METILVVVKTQRGGVHYFPDADKMDLSHGEYLAHPHHHVFHIEVGIEVVHGNRAIECHALETYIHQWLEASHERIGNDRGDMPSQCDLDFKTSSCEQLAEHIITGLHHKYATDAMSVMVLEDGVRGGRVYWVKDKEDSGGTTVD